MIHDITLRCMGVPSVLFRIKSKVYCYIRTLLTAIRWILNIYWITFLPHSSKIGVRILNLIFLNLSSIKVPKAYYVILFNYVIPLRKEIHHFWFIFQIRMFLMFYHVYYCSNPDYHPGQLSFRCPGCSGPGTSVRRFDLKLVRSGPKSNR